jgi:hypothetical protein
MWDGIYNGQTEEVWDFDIWVHDPDGVDYVIFRFQRGLTSEWENETAVLIEGNSTTGLYSGNLTYSVQWNSEMEYPNPSYFVFSFKVFANDSLSNWAETTTMTYMGGYVVISLSSTTTIVSNPYNWLVLPAVGTALAAVVILFVLRSKRVQCRAQHPSYKQNMRSTLSSLYA